MTRLATLGGGTYATDERLLHCMARVRKADSLAPPPLTGPMPLKSDLRALLFWVALIGSANLAVDLAGRTPLAWHDLMPTIALAVLIGFVLGSCVTHILKRSHEPSELTLPRHVKSIAAAVLLFAWLLSAYLSYSACRSTFLSQRTFATLRSCWETQELVQIFFFVQTFTAALSVYAWSRRMEPSHHVTAQANQNRQTAPL